MKRRSADMAIIFTQCWDILPGREDEYEKFISEEYIPECDRLGLKSVGGFYVEVGFGPKIVFLNSTDSVDLLFRRLAEKSFKDLVTRLKNYVVNYRNKILEPTGRVKHENYTIQKGVWKFNQYYDLIPGKKKEYADFVIREHIPTLEKLDYLEITGGWNVIMGGFSEIITEFTFKDPHDIARMLENQDFRNVTNKLCGDYVVNYSSRIMRTTERFDEPKWFRL
jgi:hypothetical protein